jgi:hypothetical protein
MHSHLSVRRKPTRVRLEKLTFRARIRVELLAGLRVVTGGSSARWPAGDACEGRVPIPATRRSARELKVSSIAEAHGGACSVSVDLGSDALIVWRLRPACVTNGACTDRARAGRALGVRRVCRVRGLRGADQPAAARRSSAMPCCGTGGTAWTVLPLLGALLTSLGTVIGRELPRSAASARWASTRLCCC